MNALLADIDWVKPAIFLALFVVYVIKEAVSAAHKAARPAAQPRRPPVELAQRQQINEEVGDFLRRAAERRAVLTTRTAESTPAQPKPALRGAPSGGQAATLAKTSSRRALAEPLVEVVEVQPTRRNVGSGAVAAHVQQHLDNRQFAERASQLSHVQEAGATASTRIHDVFDHQVGSLAQAAGDQTPADGGMEAAPPLQFPQVTASGLAAMLRDPDGLRQAITINEILHRPVERW